MNNKNHPTEFKPCGRAIMYIRVSRDDEVPSVQAAPHVVPPETGSHIIETVQHLLADYGIGKSILNEVKK